MVVKNVAYTSEPIPWVLTTCVCLTWTSLLIATSNFLSVPWAWLPPKKGPEHTLCLCWLPPPHVLVQPAQELQSCHWPSTGHSLRKQSLVWRHSPWHSRPPYEGPLHSECAALFHLNRTRNRNSSWTTHSTRHPLQSKRHRVIKEETEEFSKCEDRGYKATLG